MMGIKRDRLMKLLLFLNFKIAQKSKQNEYRVVQHKLVGKPSVKWNMTSNVTRTVPRCTLQVRR